MDRRLPAATVAGLLAIALVSGAAGAQATGGQAAGEAPIESCAVIDEPGTYELGANLTGATAADLANVTAADAAGNATNATAADATAGDAANATGANGTAGNATVTNATTAANVFEIDNESARACVAITTGDVVLDGAGHAIVGPVGAPGNATGANATDGTVAAGNATDAPTLVGIAVVPAAENGTIENVSVRNVTVTGFDVGVYVERAPDVSFRDVNLAGNPGGAIRVAEGPTAANATAGNGTADANEATPITPVAATAGADAAPPS